MDISKLIEKAREVQKNAYAPYSKFKVGAALLTESGNVYVGCNVENASYGLSMCAERIAIFSAVKNGEKKFRKIVIVGDTEEYISPCGACRQVIYEFGAEIDVVMVNKNNKYKIMKISELLPEGFRFDADSKD